MLTVPITWGFGTWRYGVKHMLVVLKSSTHQWLTVVVKQPAAHCSDYCHLFDAIFIAVTSQSLFQAVCKFKNIVTSLQIVFISCLWRFSLRPQELETCLWGKLRCCCWILRQRMNTASNSASVLSWNIQKCVQRLHNRSLNVEGFFLFSVERRMIKGLWAT